MKNQKKKKMSCVKLINFIVITEEEQILRIGMKNE